MAIIQFHKQLEKKELRAKDKARAGKEGSAVVWGFCFVVCLFLFALK